MIYKVYFRREEVYYVEVEAENAHNAVALAETEALEEHIHTAETDVFMEVEEVK